MKKMWMFITFYFVLSMHALWARAEPRVDYFPRFEETVESDTVEGIYGGVDAFTTEDLNAPHYEIDSVPYANCDWVGELVCQTSCERKANGAHIVSWSCEPTDGATQYHCGCVFVAPSPGPYNPPCYWNCNSGGITGVFGNGLY